MTGEEKLSLKRVRFEINGPPMVPIQVSPSEVREVIAGVVERVLYIDTTGDVKPPDAIVFDGQRFAKEPAK